MFTASVEAKPHRITKKVGSIPVTISSPTLAAEASVRTSVLRKGKVMPHIGDGTSRTDGTEYANSFWADKCILARAFVVLGEAGPVKFTLVNTCKAPRKVTAEWEVLSPESGR